MLGAARLAVGSSPQSRLRTASFNLDSVISSLRTDLQDAAEGRATCSRAYVHSAQGSAMLAVAQRAIEDGATPDEKFFRQIRELGVLNTLTTNHCVRDKAVKKDRLRSRLPSSKLDGLDGATKVCVEYFVGGSGKVRCARWSSGPGYYPGPQEEETYLIQPVRDYYAMALCADPTNTKKCGLARKYRYRRSLPYLPRNAKQARDILLPDVPGVEPGVVKIISLGPAPPLNPKRRRK